MKRNLKKYIGLDYQPNAHTTLNESNCQVVIDLPILLCWQTLPEAAKNKRL